MISRRLLLSISALALLTQPSARAGIVFQSATSVVNSTSNDTEVSATDASSLFYSAANFQVTTTTQVTGIGGHFQQGLGGPGNNEIFGAIVAIPTLSSSPTDPTLSTGVLGSTLITLPAPFTPEAQVTATLTGALNLTLAPGDYAVVFGSGQFGVTGSGGLVTSVVGPSFSGDVNTNGTPTYTISQTGAFATYQQNGARIFVTGITGNGVVPEPSSLLMLAVGVMAAAGAVARGRSRG